MSLLNDMTLPYDITRCAALKQDGKPIAPCTTCARHVQAQPCGRGTPWTIPPAFWNGTRYVCEHHMEIKNGQ